MPLFLVKQAYLVDAQNTFEALAKLEINSIVEVSIERVTNDSVPSVQTEKLQAVSE